MTGRLPSLHAVTNQLIFQRSEQNCFSHLSFSLTTVCWQTFTCMSICHPRLREQHVGTAARLQKAILIAYLTKATYSCVYDGLGAGSWPFGRPLYLKLLPPFIYQTLTPFLHKHETYYINEKEESKVVFISRLVPYTAQMDLPCYVSDQITRKPALTSAFGISPRTASHALVQNSMHELGFLLWVSSRRAICLAQMCSQKKMWRTTCFFLLEKWFKVSFLPI